MLSTYWHPKPLKIQRLAEQLRITSRSRYQLPQPRRAEAIEQRKNSNSHFSMQFPGPEARADGSALSGCLGTTPQPPTRSRSNPVVDDPLPHPRWTQAPPRVLRPLWDNDPSAHPLKPHRPRDHQPPPGQLRNRHRASTRPPWDDEPSHHPLKLHLPRDHQPPPSQLAQSPPREHQAAVGRRTLPPPAQAPPSVVQPAFPRPASQAPPRELAVTVWTTPPPPTR